MAGKHWVQYHTPDRMGYGIDECDGDGFGMLTRKDCGLHNPVGDVAWLVGRPDDGDDAVYLGGWFVVRDVEASPHPDFRYLFVGDTGRSCDPLPVVSDRDWFPQLVRLTTAFRRGLTEVPPGPILAGLRAAAAEVGCPQV